MENKKIMINYILILLVGFIIGFEVKKTCPKNHYKTDLSRQEMIRALSRIKEYNILVPGDTSVAPYLIKQ